MDREETAVRKLNYTLIGLILIFSAMLLVNAEQSVTTLTGLAVSTTQVFTKGFMIMQGISLSIILLVLILLLIRKKKPSFENADKVRSVRRISIKGF